MTQVPASSHGGGGLTWPGLTLDADGNAVLAPADALASLSEFHIVAPANANDAISVTDSAHPAQIKGAIDPFGYASLSGASCVASGNTTPLVADGAGALTTRDVANFASNSTPLLRVGHAGDVILGKHTAPADADIDAGECGLWFDQTNGAGALGLKAKTANGTVTTSKYPLRQSAGALPTVAPVSATAFQCSVTQDVVLVVPVTYNPGVATTATCKVELSPDNVTFSTLVTVTQPVGTVFDGSIEPVVLAVPTGWYVKLTVTNATLGTGTYY